MEKAAITGYSIVKPSRARKDKNEDIFTNEQYQAIALNSLLKNIQMTKKELDSTRYALVLNRPMWPHALIWTSEVISNLGLSPKLTYASDHGGASALFSMIQAQIALNSGFVDHVIVIGSDSSMTPFNSPNSFRPDRTWKYELNYEMPLGMIGPLSEAALIMRKHMETYGTTAEQLGMVAIAQRKNACQNPNAYLQKPLTMDEYLNSPMIAEPVRMLDAVIPINAAYAMMVSTPSSAFKLTDRPVFMDGFDTSLNYAATDELRDITDMGMHSSMEKLLEMIEETALSKLIESGFRDIKVDHDCVVNFLLNVSRFVDQNKELISQLDLNPVMFDGSTSIILDAKLIPRQTGSK